MIGSKKTMITPFIPLTTLKEPETQGKLLEAWTKLPICTKLAFISFGIAKTCFIVGVAFKMMMMPIGAIIVGFIYFFAVWLAIFLAARDWMVYYMEEDDKLIHLPYPDDDDASFLCNK